LKEYRKIPGVDVLLNTPEIRSLVSEHGKKITTFSVRAVIDEIKAEIRSGKNAPEPSFIIQRINTHLDALVNRSLKRVINTTGIVLHTNLGRAPYGEQFISDSVKVLKGYNNLEFDLQHAQRGSRNTHASEMLKFLTGAEDVLVVNNNAAAVMLILRTFAKSREVIVSRGELIEIGGSFRLPDILAASDCIMKEVGTTNKTKVSDYENAVSDQTALLFKAHRSNYSIEGFTQEVSLNEMVALGKKKSIPVVYDMGSGLLNTDSVHFFPTEPSVDKTLKAGVDLVCFSGDKLLGGPQAGIIAGKREMISGLRKEPMLRALRVDKLTLAFLETSCLDYLNETTICSKNLLYQMLNQKEDALKKRAEKLRSGIEAFDVSTEIAKSQGQFGGGALPGETINSFAVQIVSNFNSNKQRANFAEQMHHQLLQGTDPVLSILKKGKVYFDVLTLLDEEIDTASETIGKTYQEIIQWKST
jgi:L-seryl-tRNA(Ser) seleniumtransferase